MKTQPKDSGLAWDRQILSRIDSGVDASILRENLALTPTERIEKMTRALHVARELRRVRTFAPAKPA